MRIVAVSDLHGHLPPIPACDLLLIAGDVCPDASTNPDWTDAIVDRQEEWLRGPFREWIASIRLPPSQKVMVWGNHDYVGELRSRAALGTDLHVTIAEDEVVSCLGLRVWLSPWSNRFERFAFMRDPLELAPIYASIPKGVDVVVTHQPPYGHGDMELTSAAGLEHVGSHELLAAIVRVRPQAVICGHIHRAFGGFEHEGVPIYNVSICDEHYNAVHPPTGIEMWIRQTPRS